MEPDKKKYLTPILAVIFLLLAFVVIPLIAAESSRKHAKKIDTVSSAMPISPYNAAIGYGVNGST